MTDFKYLSGKSCRHLMRWWMIFVLFAVMAGSLRAEPHPLASSVLVVYNRDFPGSKALADYYALKRGIPERNVLGLPMSQNETITRKAYHETIAAPMGDYLSREGFWQKRNGEASLSSIRYVVLMRGVPLRIRSSREPAAKGEKRDPVRDRDEASVDSELALLGVNTEVDGFVANPYYRSFTPFVQSGLPAGMLLVCRLDGPDDMTVRAMVDDAMLAEKRGLWGWAYVDMRGIKSGGHALGDEWLQKASQEMMQQGIPLIFDRGSHTFPAGFPITNAAIYYGWYAAHANGPFRAREVDFVPGAIAVHIHSYSATSVRSATRHWVGPLLAQGAAVSIGNVFEPYLGPTTNIDLLQSRLMAGFMLADAAYASTPTLSWMTVILGDPLYRPYGIWADLARQDRDSEGGVWQDYRHVVLSHQRDVLLAGLALRELSARSSNEMPLEALGWAQIYAGEQKEALVSLGRALSFAQRGSAVSFRIRYIQMLLTSSQGDKGKALEMAHELIAENPGETRVALVEKFAESLVPKPAATP